MSLEFKAVEFISAPVIQLIGVSMQQIKLKLALVLKLGKKCMPFCLGRYTLYNPVPCVNLRLLCYVIVGFVPHSDLLLDAAEGYRK